MTTQQHILHANCLDVLAKLEENSVDALATDPPYGLSFMNKGWDQVVPGPEYWKAVLRVLKPGAYGLVMCGTRTSHRLGCALEDSGFEIRDKLGWLYGSGFPKSHNVALGIDKMLGHKNRGKAIPTASTHQATGAKLEGNPVDAYTAKSPESEPWEGFGTALKPAWEDIYLVRKPFKGTVAKNVLEYGTGALNIDAARIGTEEVTINRFKDGMKPFGDGAGHEYASTQQQGRWPANIVMDEEAGAMLDEQSGISKDGMRKKKNADPEFRDNLVFGASVKDNTASGYGSGGGASRFFYCAKAGVKEREAGLHTDPTTVGDGRKKSIDNPYQRGKTKRRNTHPTVKPLSLCRWLSRLICPPGGLLIDPFAGSGTFGCAAAMEDFNWIGVEIEDESATIAFNRIKHWRNERCKTEN
jgi:site-specific DNA-methyltransferase (adenine-specific)